MTDAVREALGRLRSAVDHGRLDADLERCGVGILGAFGSAVRDGPEPRDLDIAAGPAEGETIDLLELIAVLVRAIDYENIDLGIVDGTHPVFDSEALSGLPLYERGEGDFARAQMRALAQRRDAAPFRQLDLDRWARSG